MLRITIGSFRFHFDIFNNTQLNTVSYFMQKLLRIADGRPYLWSLTDTIVGWDGAVNFSPVRARDLPPIHSKNSTFHKHQGDKIPRRFYQI